jgi:hypothetical protein
MHSVLLFFTWFCQHFSSLDDKLNNGNALIIFPILCKLIRRRLDKVGKLEFQWKKNVHDKI